MGQRVMLKKNGKAKGVAIRKSGGSNPNNTVTVGKVTYRGGGNSNRNSTNKRKVRRKRRA